MATLTNTKIKDTYDGLLKTTDNEALDVSGVTLIEDGLGNASALSVGRSGNGVSVSGLLDVSGEVQGTSLDINGAADISGNLAVDTNTLYVDAANNRVGVGTSSPATKLHLNDSTDSDMSIRLQNSPSILYVGVDNTTGSRFIGSSGSAAYIGTTTSSPIEFATANTVRAIIDSSGRLGIGTSSPTYPMQLTGAGDTTFGIEAGATSLASLNLGNSTNLADGGIRYDNSTDALIFRANNAEKMRIDSSGNVGIGTQSADDLLHLQGSEAVVGATQLTLEGRYEGYSAGINFVSRTSNEGTRVSMAKITADGEDSWSTTASTQDAGLRFFTTLNGSQSERMRITSGGYLKASNDGSYAGASDSFHELRTNIGDWTTYISSTHSSPFGVVIKYMNASPNNTTNYFLEAIDSTTSRFRVASNGNVTNTNNSYGAISDAKLKENVTDASPKLDDLLQVKVRNFNYIGDDKKQLGVVAQELEEVFPSMIDESPDFEEQEVTDEEGNVTKERVDLGTTTKSVKYSVFVPMLIKAMQEQQEIINDLKARIETLEAK